MRKIFVTLHLLLFCSLLRGQENVDMQMMQKIKDEEARHSQVPMLAQYLTDVCGPRLTNSPGYRKAVAWSVKTLKQWGLQNAAPEPWGQFGKGWSNEEFSLTMKLPYSQPLIAFPAAWTKSTKGHISAKVVLLEQLDSASINKLGNSLKGSIVLVKSVDTVIKTPFKADATRFEESELNNLPDFLMTTSEK
jgi:carboxypeptidase Q